eukprot:1331014-Pyramimonas_sp.AAC.1
MGYRDSHVTSRGTPWRRRRRAANATAQECACTCCQQHVQLLHRQELLERGAREVRRGGDEASLARASNSP